MYHVVEHVTVSEAKFNTGKNGKYEWNFNDIVGTNGSAMCDGIHRMNIVHFLHATQTIHRCYIAQHGEEVGLSA